MPPFGDEPTEKDSRPLGFLSFCDASAPRPSKRKPSASAFGPESAESEPRGFVGGTRPHKVATKRPFEDEDGEGVTPQPSKSMNYARKSTVFADESSEDDSGKFSKPFGDEGGESDSMSLSSGDEASFVPKKDTVFTFGWNSVSTFKQATFWKENMDNEAAKPTKRQYDNSKRAAKAVYARRESKGFYKRNGMDPARLQKLFSAPSCSCAFVRISGGISQEILGIIYDHLVSIVLTQTRGAKKICFKQFTGSKELATFLEHFWKLSKQDQDSIVPC